MRPDRYVIVERDSDVEVRCLNGGQLRARWVVPTRAAAEALVRLGSSVFEADGRLLRELFGSFRADLRTAAAGRVAV